MEEVIKYFESLEARLAAAEQSLAAAEEQIAAQEETISALQAQVEELQNRPLPEPEVVEKVVEKIVEVEKPVEVIKEVVVEKPVVVAAPVVEPGPVIEEEPAVEPEPVVEEESIAEEAPVAEAEPEKQEAAVEEETASPKAAIYGKAVDDIRLAISLGDRFLYQRELFGQNAELMQRTLNELNDLDSFDEAIRYIDRFNWDSESKTYQQFLVTLHRRFG